MATATALARARPAKTTCNPTPTSQIIGPEGPKHPGNRQLYDKRGCPDAGAPLCGNHADTKVATFCAALWLTFTLPLTALPPTIGQFVVTLKETTLVVVIGFFDVMASGNAAFGTADWNFAQIEVYAFLAFVFFVFTFSLSRYGALLERRLRVHSR
jgi:hypothetical protein